MSYQRAVTAFCDHADCEARVTLEPPVETQLVRLHDLGWAVDNDSTFCPTHAPATRVERTLG